LVITAAINSTPQSLSGSDTAKTVGSTTSLLVNESAKLAAAATKGSVEYSVAWSTGNNQVASVDSNGNVTGVGEGSTTVTATLTSGSETITVAFPVDVSATPPTLDKNSVFFYLLRPGKSDVASDTTAWAPFGVGTLKYEAAQDSSAAVDDIVAVNPNIDDLIDDYPVPYFPDSNSYSNGYVQSMSKGTYPTFERTVNGETVTYKYEGDTSAANAAITHTYSIRWDRVKKCNGANCEGYNAWVQSGKYTWHVDGTVIFPDLVTVSYKVQDPNDDDFHIVENVWQTTDFTYTRDPQDKISSITLWPTSSNQGLSYAETGYVDDNGIEWEFDGWYLNAACTISVASVSGEQLQKYATDHQVFFYGKYVPKTYTVTYVYASPSASNAVVTKRYSVNSVTDLYVPLPKAPNGKNAYFAGWYFYDDSDEPQLVQMSPFIDENKNVGSPEVAEWVADANNERNMTIYAVYYTANTNTLKIADYDGLKTYTGTPQPEVIASVDSGTIFGAPAKATVSIQGSSYDVVQALVKLSDEELKSWDQTGFVLSQSAAADVASCPTVQGGYQFVYDGKVFYTGSGSHAHYIRFVLDAIESGNYYATPFLAKLSVEKGDDGEPVYSEFVYGPAALVYIQ
ncbi:MAG: Ig-like domain-containing protein, partial [Butyricicoccus sp.]